MRRNCVAVLEPAAERVAPRCRHFGVCGGCTLQHLDSAAQLAIKEQQLRENLTRVGRVEPARVARAAAGPQWQYRRRARLGARFVHARGRSMVGFRERYSSRVAELERCEVLAPPVDALIAPSGRAADARCRYASACRRSKWPIAENAVVLVLRVLDAPTPRRIAIAAARIRARARRAPVPAAGRPRYGASARASRPPALEYTLPEFALRLRFEPSDFIQVNADAQPLAGRPRGRAAAAR